MKIREIVANSTDLSGGEIVRQKLDDSVALLNVLNVIDTMMQELSISSKAVSQFKQSAVFAANTDTGSLTPSNISFHPKFIRYRESGNLRWEILPILDDIEDLTRRENDWERAVVFTGNPDDLTYYLSWIPTESLTVELWANQVSQEVTDLDAKPPFPEEFSLLCAYRAAEINLNQLLAIDARMYSPFVIAQKQSLSMERKKLDHIWNVYKAIPSDAGSADRMKSYDTAREYFEEDEEFAGLY